MRDATRLPPFTDRRNCPAALPLPSEVKAYAAELAAKHGDDPADVIADLLTFAADDIEGAVFDPRELGFSTDGDAS